MSSKTPQQIENQFLKTYDKKGLDEALKPLLRLDLIHERAHYLSRCGMVLYWQRKALGAALKVLQTNIEITTPLVEESRETETLAFKLETNLKATHYNIASITWPGWNERGINVDSEQMKMGVRSAEENLRLAKHLGDAKLPLSRGHWMRAAHFIESNELELAMHHFKVAADLAHESGSEGEALLSRAFLRLTEYFAKASGAKREEVERLRVELLLVKDGENFARQINQALLVYESRYYPDA